jgi:hypothetical protein
MQRLDPVLVTWPIPLIASGYGKDQHETEAFFSHVSQVIQCDPLQPNFAEAGVEKC